MLNYFGFQFRDILFRFPVDDIGAQVCCSRSERIKGFILRNTFRDARCLLQSTSPAYMDMRIAIYQVTESDCPPAMINKYCAVRKIVFALAESFLFCHFSSDARALARHNIHFR